MEILVLVLFSILVYIVYTASTKAKLPRPETAIQLKESETQNTIPQNQHESKNPSESKLNSNKSFQGVGTLVFPIDLNKHISEFNHRHKKTENETDNQHIESKARLSNKYSPSSHEKKQKFLKYFECSLCRIGGYLSCPRCLGAGGYFETVYELPPHIKPESKTEVEIIKSKLQLAMKQVHWNEKLLAYLEGRLTFLKMNIVLDGAIDLIKEIEAARKQQNTKKQLNNLYRFYNGNPDIAFTVRGRKLVNSFGTISKDDLLQEYIQFKFRGNEYEKTFYNRRKTDKLIEFILFNSSAIKLNSEFYLLNKDIEAIKDLASFKIFVSVDISDENFKILCFINEVILINYIDKSGTDEKMHPSMHV